MAKDFIKIDKNDVEGEEVDPATKTKKRQVVVSGSKMTVEERGVIYLSNVPHGFYENQMFKFFSQFGKVTNIRLGRSKKTGNFRGYAFVEFRFAEVAKVVAQTMNNYLMYEKLMKCSIVPPEKVRPAIFRHRVNPEKPPGKKARQNAKKEVNMDRDPRQEQKRRRRQYGQVQKSAAKLRALGIDIQADLPDIESEIQERRDRIKAEGRTPVMAIDDSDLDITLKTPPNVRKIKSRQNSAALTGSTAGVTPFSGKLKSSKKRELMEATAATPPSTKEQVSKKKKQSKLFTPTKKSK